MSASQRVLTVTVGLLLALASPTTVLAQDTGWKIVDFQSTFDVRADGSLAVTERIEVDFGQLQRRGIYRDVEVRYRRLANPVSNVSVGAGTVSVELEVDRVTDERERPRTFKTSGRNTIRIRIGDPDRWISGRQTYVIHYTLSWGLGFFEQHDELYWQVTGTEWPVPIDRASAVVTLPTAASRERAESTPWAAECYSGSSGSTSGDRCTASVEEPGRFRFSTVGLGPGEGLTLVALFPKGIVAAPSALLKTRAWLVTIGPLALPFVVFAFLLAWWWKRGREPDVGSIMPNWEPPEGLRPGPAGTLLDQRAGMDDIVATVLDLAVRGYLRIDEVEPDGPLSEIDESSSVILRALKAIAIEKEDWELVRLRDEWDELRPFERRVLRGLFTEGDDQRRLSDLHQKFYKHIDEIQDSLYVETVRQKFFRQRPDRTRREWVLGGVVIMIGGVVGIFLQHWALTIGLGLSGLIVILFSWGMPAMTPIGAQARRQLEGLREYMRRAEKAELEFRNAPERSPALFEALLPFAIALGVSSIWIEQFAGLITTPPSWYVGNVSAWDSGRFQSGLASFQSAASSALASAPGGSSGGGGGGSVGGGGGGGGGGSW